jgi:hypothetical protein
MVFDAVEAMNPMHNAPRCGARTRQGRPCAAPAIKGKRRCRMHGGLSTGPRTVESLERSRRARWIHVRYSREAREARTAARRMRPSTEAERRAAMRRFAREGARAARSSLTAFRRMFGRS